MSRDDQRLERPNAWLSELQRVATLLDRVYAHTRGEIWLFDNDLKVLDAHPHPDQTGAFQVLYNQRIDGSLAARVRCVKILLRRNLYDEFCDPVKRPGLFANLCGLRPNRLDTFFVGCLDDVNPPKALGGHHPWIFYLGQGHLQSQDGIVIVRPHVYPFSYKKDDKGDVAIAWSTSDPELIPVHFRINRDWFTRVFVTAYQTHFRSIYSEREGADKVMGYHLGEARTERQIDELCWSLKALSAAPVMPPVDCAIVTALGEEYEAALSVLGLARRPDGGFATGRLCVDRVGRDITVVATQCPRTGSVHAAAQTAHTIERWRPRCVVLLGRCAGAPVAGSPGGSTEAPARIEDDRHEGDVIVANDICAYEYQALLSDAITQADVRWVPVSRQLLQVAQALIREGWSYSGDLPKGWTNNRQPKAFEGAVASGCKLLRAGANWFEDLKRAAGRRKILAGEMEGEGVGVAVQAYLPAPQFLFIKGISDFGDPDKGDRYNEFASTTAAQFLRDVMSHSDFLALLRRLEDASEV